MAGPTRARYEQAGLAEPASASAAKHPDSFRQHGNPRRIRSMMKRGRSNSDDPRLLLGLSTLKVTESGAKALTATRYHCEVQTRRKPLIKKAVVVRRLVEKVENWPTVLVRYMAARFGIASSIAMEVRLRDGLVVAVPAAPSSSWPIVEVLVLDCYHTSMVPGSPAVILDIGAHVGSASLALHRAFPDARMVCYEPSPATADFLRRNLSGNGVTAEVHEFAVAGRDGHAYLVSDTATSCGASVVFDDSGGMPITVASFDHVMEKLDSGPVLLKLDCEGSEFAILEQSLGSSFSTVQTVLLEYHPRRVSGGYARVCAGLERFGFSEAWHDPDIFHDGLGLSCFVRSSG